MASKIVMSWGRVQRVRHEVIGLSDRSFSMQALPSDASHLLPYGNGRSYGDSCLNAGGALLDTRRLDKFISFDHANGVLACESGVLLDEILRLVVPQGWFLPVTPGTRFITVGGAIANDVHGKNHHRAGTFGRHVRRFELLRSGGRRRLCSATENAEWFCATIGGLGLTGLITWAEIQLRRVGNPWMDVETIRTQTLDDFFALSNESDRDYEYAVAWIDCTAEGKHMGRGLFMRANHAPAMAERGTPHVRMRHLAFASPVSLVNPLTLRAFNAIYYHKQYFRPSRSMQHYESFFYPLDGIPGWNKMYGPRGFYQYQCVVPIDPAKEAVTQLLREIGKSGMGSVLAVLKLCGAAISPGPLSFPQNGASLALDFPNCGERLHHLFTRLDSIVEQAGGRIYPAKDGRMSGEMFRTGYPEWKVFKRYIDPRFSSSFWRRVMET